MRHFNDLASSWWKIDGPQRILHKMNLLRMDFIQKTFMNSIQLNEPGVPLEQQIYVPAYNLDLLPKQISSQIVKEQDNKRFSEYDKFKFNVLDIGCGGGILSESMARLPIVNSVTGIDLSTEVIKIAKIHKAKDPLINSKLSYRLQAIEDVEESEQFEVITMMEVLEHVNLPSVVLNDALKHLKKDGVLFLSTINRDFVSWFTTIFMGEYILKVVPVGTHHLEKYINSSEVQEWFNELNSKSTERKYEILDCKGCAYLPLNGWFFTNTTEIGNYMMAIKRVD
ncbi:hexaprenyldihydroxybenzoate methyltransferase [Ascoidea rubescens DSM 1968]|uniref:Ubiquinone biosynthesis O-methyltransferase, mitochondrial n=1 Tax=Ascoidea rubescens DSM 1968 TaxID=1344418 RepID=A0A1D2VRI9_9ASCO|nr:3,4-dihydroxy-5-hexaprenylbenzoate methyltransferase [Ascoidea rubescens DSM 1968]ODV64187.1 3,4-dihydroxy-5-hexaprenylbenzoate methyltransferase [Ascoidea rubescens DSM 1968]